jgi:hypothetical protein
VFSYTIFLYVILNLGIRAKRPSPVWHDNPASVEANLAPEVEEVRVDVAEKVEANRLS